MQRLVRTGCGTGRARSSFVVQVKSPIGSRPRRTRGAGESGVQVRRHLHHAPALGRRQHFESLAEVFAIAEARGFRQKSFISKTAYSELGQDSRGAQADHAARDEVWTSKANQYPQVRASNGTDASLPI